MLSLPGFTARMISFIDHSSSVMRWGQVVTSGVEVWFKDSSEKVRKAGLDAVSPQVLAGTRPWRVFRSYRGQKHYSGWYWSATTGRHVVYESRLELARLLLADFAADVVGIAAQPFQIVDVTAERVRRHVPDFLLLHRGGAATVLNVKPARRLEDPAVAEALGWAGDVFRGHGLGYEVWSGTDPVVLANVRFLSGYRYAGRVDMAVAGRVLGALPARLSELESSLGAGAAVVRPAALHLLWSGRARTDLSRSLSVSHLLEPVA